MVLLTQTFLLIPTFLLVVFVNVIQAATTLIIEGGQLAGARGVIVKDDDGVTLGLYDVRFQDGSCVGLFGGCDDASDFTFAGEDSNLASFASKALLRDVFLDGQHGSFDSVPSLTVGCEDANSCRIFTPYLGDDCKFTSERVGISGAGNRANENQDVIINSGGIGTCNLDFTDLPDATYAKWTLVQGPELTLNILDGNSLIGNISESGYVTPSGGDLNEIDIKGLTGQEIEFFKRVGLVADGNARLLIRAQTNFQNNIEFTIINPSSTKSRFENLSRKNKDQTRLVIQAEDVGDELFQSTAVLVAEESFPGSITDAEAQFDLRVCIKDSGNSCLKEEIKPIRVRRAPVVLIHGIWGNKKAWLILSHSGGNVNLPARGLLPTLRSNFFKVETFDYTPNWQGPLILMRPENKEITNTILMLCGDENLDRIACTQADFVTHSMGGLMARKYIHDNKYYRNKTNYGQGSIRRLITLGTPHLGSGLANLIIKRKAEIGSCISDYEMVDTLRSIMERFGKKVSGYGAGIYDIAINSRLLNRLNSQLEPVKTFALIGNTGKNLPFLDAVIERTGCTHNNLFQNGSSDQLVSLRSARGNLSSFNTKILSGVPHSGMGKNQKIIEETLALLNEESTNFSPVVFQTPNRGEKKNKKEHQPGYLEQIFVRASEAVGKLLNILLGIREASAQEQFSAFLTVNSATQRPGGRVTFTANVTGIDILSVNLTDGNDIFLEDAEPPYEWTFKIPPNSSGETIFKVIAVVGQTVVESNAVTLKILPNLSGLESLRFEVANPFTLFPGRTRQQDVIGEFSDGFVRNLTQEALGTIYSERVVNGGISAPGDSPSIEISSDGLVRGLEPGVAEIIATNSGFTAVRRVHVVSLSADDSDGDGLKDEVEDNIGTDKFHPDSDGDGAKDGVEVGRDPQNPRNANNDNFIDALDTRTIVVQDETGGFVSIFSSSGTIKDVFSLPLADMPELPLNLSTLNMEHGVFGFRIENLTPGQTVNVTLDFDSLAGNTNGYFKYGSKTGNSNPPKWYDFPDFSVSGNRIILHLRDNGHGDENPVPGVITDPGGPAKAENLPPPSIPGDLDSDGDIDMTDVQLFQSTFGKCDGQAEYNPKANFDDDTCITFVDYQTWYGLFLAQQYSWTE